DAQVALTLRLAGGLSTRQIARAFLQPEATIAQRLVRAKRTLADLGATLTTTGDADLADRLPAVLSVIYLIFNEGYLTADGVEPVRLDLRDDARRLGQLVAALAPDGGEVHGL